jgi:hypothetical protein
MNGKMRKDAARTCCILSCLRETVGTFLAFPQLLKQPNRACKQVGFRALPVGDRFVCWVFFVPFPLLSLEGHEKKNT